MKKLNKITFTATADEAAVIKKAIAFFLVSCTKATAENPDGINELSDENMAVHEISIDQLDRLVNFKEWISGELADLEAWNAEVTHFESLTETE